MSTPPNRPDSSATIQVFGDVRAPDFPSWIRRHADKLGVRHSLSRPSDTCLRVVATGPEEMLEALALGCSLGPSTVMVERVEISRSEVDLESEPLPGGSASCP